MVAEYGSLDDCLGVSDFKPSLLVLMPKKPARTDAELGRFYRAGDTSPLMLADTSSRIIAEGLGFKLEPVVERVVTECQRGLPRGRSISTKIVVWRR